MRKKVPPTVNVKSRKSQVYSRMSQVYSKRSRVYSRRSGVYSRRSMLTDRRSTLTVPWDPLNGTGDDFFGGHAYILCVSNDLSEKNGTKIGPFKVTLIIKECFKMLSICQKKRLVWHYIMHYIQIINTMFYYQYPFLKVNVILYNVIK